MSSYVSVEITCPHCDKTHRFTMVPEGASGKETGVDRSHQTRTPEEFAENIRELKGKADERAAAIRRQLADLKGKEEQGRQPLSEGIKEELLQRQEKAEKKGHAPKLSKKQRSRLLNRHLKGRPGSTRKPKTSALLDSNVSNAPSPRQGCETCGQGPCAVKEWELMSSCHSEFIPCSRCGHKGDYIVWDSVNTQRNPELADKVKDESLFEWTCPHCGHKETVWYPCLYHDMAQRFMVYYCDDAKLDVPRVLKGPGLSPAPYQDAGGVHRENPHSGAGTGRPGHRYDEAVYRGRPGMQRRAGGHKAVLPLY